MAVFQSAVEIPDISGADTAASLAKIRNYLFLLREQLDHVLGNIGVENLNEQSVKELKAVITSDIAARIADDEDRLTALELTARGLSLSVRDSEGKVSSIDLTSGALDLDELVFSLLREGGATVIDGGNITTGTISAVDIEGVRINGSVFTSEGEDSLLRLDAARVAFLNAAGNVPYGGLYSDRFGDLYLYTDSGVALAVASDGDLRLTAKADHTINVGTEAGQCSEIVLGNGDGDIRINGRLWVNGVAFS